MQIKFLVLCVCISSFATAQKENIYIDKGNKAYEQNAFADAENNYKEALQKNPDSEAGNYNLGNSYYKQQKFEESIQQYQAIAKATMDPAIRSKAYHNLGNTYMEMQDWQKSVDAYKNALKSNPNDAETKYNLAYAQSKLKQQQQQQQNKQDQNKDNEDKQDQQDQQKEDEQKKQDQQKNEQNQKEQKQDKQQQTQPKKYSPEELERIMQTLNNEDKKVQDKVNQQKTDPVRVKIEKDW